MSYIHGVCVCVFIPKIIYIKKVVSNIELTQLSDTSNYHSLHGKYKYLFREFCRKKLHSNSLQITI